MRLPIPGVSLADLYTPEKRSEEEKEQLGGKNVPVKTEDFAENENEDHADEDAALLHVGAHALIANDTDRVARRQTCEADGETGAEVHEATGRKGDLVSTRPRVPPDDVVGRQEGQGTHSNKL